MRIWSLGWEDPLKKEITEAFPGMFQTWLKWLSMINIQYSLSFSHCLIHELHDELSLWKAWTDAIAAALQILFLLSENSFKCSNYTCCLFIQPSVCLFIEASLCSLGVCEYFSYIVFSILIIIYSSVLFAYFVHLCVCHVVECH